MQCLSFSFPVLRGFYEVTGSQKFGSGKFEVIGSQFELIFRASLMASEGPMNVCIGEMGVNTCVQLRTLGISARTFWRCHIADVGLGVVASW